MKRSTYFGILAAAHTGLAITSTNFWVILMFCGFAVGCAWLCGANYSYEHEHPEDN